MGAERALVHGRIRTMAGPDDVADWMLLDGGSVVRIGSGAGPEVEGAETIDFTGRTVLPALHDAHVHLLSTGFMRMTVDLAPAESMDELFSILADAVRGFEGELLRAHTFDPDLLPDGRYPTAADLDAISREIPIYVKRRDGHSSIANTPAMELLDVPADTPGLEEEGGTPTGVFRGKAHSIAANRSGELWSDEARVRAYKEAARLAASRGVGIVHSLVGATDPGDRYRDIELLVETASDLDVDVVVYPQTLDIDRVAGLGLPRIGGCILLDGSFSSSTAALDEPYVDGGGLGNLYFEDDKLTGFMRRAHERGLQIAVHALGERAISQAVRCYKKACGKEAADARHRIEHCELPRPGHLADIVRTGISVCVQPTFEYLWGGEGGMYEKRLGAERAGRSNPFRTMLEAGVRLAGGSDSYVTPLDSLLGIHSAVNRPNRSERLSVYDAVSLFTSGAARFSFDEARRGTLEAGKEASFVVLADDPFEVDPLTIKDIRVESLYRRGERVDVESS
ncbi:MAG: amidohydrolase family protein [Candidatus Eisenbacteria bacterium]|nr:amidohydrolase family protein [Candidatus Eisenbacteria bacterium]